MSCSKILAMTVAALALCLSQGWAATFTECYRDTCVMITVPDQVAPETDFEILVEGYTEGASSWSVSAYQLLEDAEWQYDREHMVRTSSGRLVEARGFHWGGAVTKSFVLNRPAGSYGFTFVFGPRSWQHGYYDVAVDAELLVGATARPVPFDIKPQSCPNPLNIARNGVVSAAIVGSADFDASQVDPATIEVAGVSPIHHAWEDVTEPYLPETGKSFELDCTTGGPDGYLDLTLKFKARDLVEALEGAKGEPLVDGETILVEMNADLVDGSPLAGEDVVRVLRKK